VTRALSAGLVGAWVVALAAGQQTAPVYRATADAVTVPVTVRDKNRPIAGLTAADFSLLDNGVEQMIAVASIASVPIDVTLVMDTSGSVGGRALDQFKLDVQAISDLLETRDRVRLITFAADAADVFNLQPAGTRLPLSGVTSGGITALYDALAGALIAVSTNERPQLVMAFSDGFDTTSFLDATRLAALAAVSNASLYVVLVNSSSTAEDSEISPSASSGRIIQRLGAYAGGPNLPALRIAAERTGGAVYDGPAGESLPTIFKKLLDEFRTGYVLTYSPTGVPRGGWHDISVRCHNSAYSVRARPGYDGRR
jgi:VWFA-related protein